VTNVKRFNRDYFLWKLTNNQYDWLTVETDRSYIKIAKITIIYRCKFYYSQYIYLFIYLFIYLLIYLLPLQNILYFYRRTDDQYYEEYFLKFQISYQYTYLWLFVNPCKSIHILLRAHNLEMIDKIFTWKIQNARNKIYLTSS